MACNGCYEIKAKACSGDIYIPAKLTAFIGKTVIVVMRDKFGAEYIQECDVDGTGDIFYSLSEFPDGYFNPFFGPVFFKFYQNLETQCPLLISITDCNSITTEYDCVKATPTATTITNSALLEQENLGLLEQENEGGIVIQE